MRLKSMSALVMTIAFLTFGQMAQAETTLVEDLPGITNELQTAVDMAAPGDTIEVGPGSFAGAAIWKSLTIVGSIGTVIDEGAHPYFDAAFDIYGPEASGTEIRGMTINGLGWGVYGTDANDVIVMDNEFTNTSQAIANWNGSRWQIKQNIIDGLDNFDAPIVHMDTILVAALGSSASDNQIINNWIRHTGTRPNADELFYIGILLIDIEGELARNLVANNYVELSVADLDPYYGDHLAGISLVSYSSSSGIVENKVLHNKLCVTSNPIEFVALNGDAAEMRASNLIKANFEVCENYGD